MRYDRLNDGNHSADGGLSVAFSPSLLIHVGGECRCRHRRLALINDPLLYLGPYLRDSTCKVSRIAEALLFGQALWWGQTAVSVVKNS